ncbi:glycosyltransferase family 4 protein [Cellulomonas triticagri]|uniref:Glycosyltransferase n=1 Tax=Cellulomonas triticagri TaxID=2483352 RepID=A0A3M2J7C5_9CELL|nr:glycosyltransferase family 4 protein [Cellulomonas triticagri]RMI06845.1 glycosyltransferase [Cellulomonas triticagri]
MSGDGGRVPEVHVLTPGDHFSPRTGSAIPTVVDGLCAALPAGTTPRPRVAVADGTYPDRYASADVIGYPLAVARPADRYVDALAGRLGLPRPGVRRTLAPTVAEQDAWPAGAVLAHNAPQLVPLVHERHAAVLYAHNLLLRTYTPREADRVLGRAAAIVCVSGDLAEQTAVHLPAALRSRLRVVPNGVDTTRFTPRADPARGERLRVVFVGRMIRDKGADVLLDALALLDRDDVEVTLVGSQNFDAAASLSPFEREVAQKAAALGDRVRLVPFRPRAEVADLYREADVVVVPSRWAEPFALTVMEGMASGVPVVASAIGGIPEVMGDAGVRVRPDDPADLAAALTALADDEMLRRTVGRGCRLHAEARDWAWARGRLDAVLAEVAGLSPRPVG